ncbi:MAG TPA: Crp/Fnr family transcriptional regulator [Patescibacteria group bacterium]|jgi:CRP-like cAMP-binding protein|nr:Crp/Fnr family transcriptional regulator [Patescibacteria group bacterium]
MTSLPFDLKATCTALARSALFQGLDPTELEQIAQAMSRRRYRPHEVIFHEGDPGDALHLVVEGQVKIARESNEGGEAIVAILTAGDTFGELVLLDGAPRSATAIAVAATETLVMSRAVFTGLIDGTEMFRWRVLGGIADRIRRVTDQLAEVHFLDLSGRLALQLSRLAEESAPGQLAEVELRETLSQSDLAAMVGGTRQRVNQILGDFTEEGLVRQHGGRVVVRDVARLRGRASW